MRSQKGFTLLEVMVGLAVLGIMVTMIWQISSGTIDTKERVEKRDQIYQTARIAMDSIVKDLSMAFLVTNSELLGKTKDGQTVETAFIGDDKGGFDELNFNSFSNWRMYRDTKESEQAEIGYSVERDEEDKELYRLTRRVSPYLDDNVIEGGSKEPVAVGITGFELEYYDGREHDWTKNWNSEEVDQKDKMPRAVKVTISFKDADNPDEMISFSTIGFIELWQYPIEF